MPALPPPGSHHREAAKPGQVVPTAKGLRFRAYRRGEELFFHRTRTLETDLSKLKEGTEVLFDVEVTPKGAEAIQVELAAGGAPKPPSPEQEDVEGEIGLVPTP